MNDELIKILRWVSQNDEFVFAAEQAKLAADALEPMQRQINQCNARNAEQAKIIDDLQDKTINWLSDRVDELAIECGKKDTEIAQLKAERDAAVEDIHIAATDDCDIGICVICVHAEEYPDDKNAACWNCTRGESAFEWRGLQGRDD